MEFNKEQIEKAKNCKTIEELKELAKNEGLNLSENEVEQYFNATRVGELTDDELNAIAGGKGDWVQVWNKSFLMKCPFCGDIYNVDVRRYEKSGDHKYESSPSVCPCGANIEYYDSTMNFLFVKNGDRRIGIRLH